MSGTRKKNQLDQRGIASFLFTLIMMLVISLIVLSFAQIARRGQRESLDAQLSSQAYYAAESGVNDVTFAIAELLRSGNNNIDNDTCELGPQYRTILGASATEIGTTGDNIEYICAKVDATPSDLIIKPVSTSESTVKSLDTEDDNVTEFTFEWTPREGVATPASSCPSPSLFTVADTELFVPHDEWACGYGLLRFDIVQVSKIASVTREGLASDTVSVFAVPTNSGSGYNSNINYNANRGGVARVGANCDSTSCRVTLSSLGSTPNNKFVIRAQSVYSEIPQLTVTAKAGASATKFTNSQAVIDVTGKAQDVLRRLQVRVPIDGQGGGIPGFALSVGESLCKRYSVGAGLFEDYAACPLE